MTEITGVTAELDRIIDQCKRVEIIAQIESDGETQPILILCRGEEHAIEVYVPHKNRVSSMTNALKFIRESFFKNPGSVLKTETITVKATKPAIPLKKLTKLIIDAWHEDLGIEKVSDDELKEKQQEFEAATKGDTADAVKLLGTGKAGVQKWNAKSSDDRRATKLARTDLRGLELDGINLKYCNLVETRFDDSKLTQADLKESNLKSASFKNCAMNSSVLEGCNIEQTDFRGGSFEKASFANTRCKRAMFNAAEFDNTSFVYSKTTDSDFSQAHFNQANFYGSEFKNCNLESASIDKCKFTASKWQSIDATNSRILECELVGVDLRNSIFRNATIDGVDFSEADLRGVDFTDAQINYKSCKFDYALFDENTMLQDDFPINDLKWKGKGPHPEKIRKFKETSPQSSLDFPEFMQRLPISVDKKRIEKVVAMLKAEKFQLFARVCPNEKLIGVVKSQTEPDLYYACKISDKGEYTCCTNRLNACGGLHGAVCKHILVLVIGLVKAEELDPNQADLWIRSSKLYKPSIDRDELAEVFMEYKSAEDGAIDWRPTETIPEDYYAY